MQRNFSISQTWSHLISIPGFVLFMMKMHYATQIIRLAMFPSARETRSHTVQCAHSSEKWDESFSLVLTAFGRGSETSPNSPISVVVGSIENHVNVDILLIIAGRVLLLKRLRGVSQPHILALFLKLGLKPQLEDETNV